MHEQLIEDAQRTLDGSTFASIHPINTEDSYRRHQLRLLIELARDQRETERRLHDLHQLVSNLVRAS